MIKIIINPDNTRLLKLIFNKLPKLSHALVLFATEYTFFKVHTGISWSSRPLKRWSGTNWEPALLKVWHNSAWHEI